jgi:prevent-host-death family protein
MSLGKFQANCPAILKNVQQTNEAVLITRQGKPLVKIIPANRIPAQKFLGRLEGKVKIVGDIESPMWRTL